MYTILISQVVRHPSEHEGLLVRANHLHRSHSRREYCRYMHHLNDTRGTQNNEGMPPKIWGVIPSKNKCNIAKLLPEKIT